MANITIRRTWELGKTEFNRLTESPEFYLRVMRNRFTVEITKGADDSQYFKGRTWRQIRTWLDENCTDFYFIFERADMAAGVIFFEEKDAVAFKLSFE